MSSRRCVTCGSRNTSWVDDSWICNACGDEFQELPTLIPEARYRVARKQWRCTCADPGSHNHSAKAPFCSGDILPGDRYVEYEPGPHWAGTRYCLLCGLASFCQPLDADQLSIQEPGVSGSPR